MSEQAPERGSVHVVGTAHVSADSVEEVERVIEEERPDVVAVELDEGRYRQLRGDGPEDLDASDLLRGNTVFQFLAYWMLSYVQARLGDEFDINPGADMLAGIDAAERLGIDVALVDRDIQVTIQRFWARLSAFEKLKLVGGLALNVTDGRSLGLATGLFLGASIAVVAEAVAGPFLVPPVAPGVLVAVADTAVVALAVGAALGAVLALAFGVLDEEPEDVEEFDMSDLTNTDVVSAMMEEFRRFSPGGAEALIDERDAFIAHRLVALREGGRDVVAVVGAGHREGIERYLARPETLPPMDSLVGTQSGRRVSLAKVVGYLFTLGFLAFFVLLAMAGVRNSFLLELFAAWFLVNGVFTFALAKVAGAHWTSALVGGAVAWLTSINPLLAPGWFAGYVELRYTDVNVADIATLNEILSDEESPVRDLLARMREVPLFRLILVVALTNVGSFVGSMVFLWVFVPVLFSGQGITSAGEIVGLLLEGVRNSVDLLLGVAV
ncbi:TraB/GumN family protein [Halomarina pelagica]|uniref:TraB/GumN family protein n=1 Tax=Halomarina pelagica TaxID=2961599 RepID=UPI0020C4A047|nr:TraB/GumN family protein [Halomarina sp. BND7]